VLDKVAELLSDYSRNEDVMANKGANIVERNRGIEIAKYYPIMFICAAIGIAVAFGAKLSSTKMKGKMYEPLLR